MEKITKLLRLRIKARTTEAFDRGLHKTQTKSTGFIGYLLL
jgi:hypothetical protein